MESFYTFKCPFAQRITNSLENHYRQLKKVIGIVSYLPDNPNIRITRLANLYILINKLNSLFNLPIIIIAQNYTDKELNEFSSKFHNTTFLCYEKLGICKAREVLRQYFLQSTYEVIILLDDDSVVSGNFGKEYLRQIDEHPGKIYEFCKSRHKLMAVHRDVYKLLAYDLENIPEAHLAYEDRLYFWTLIGKYGSSIHYRFTMTGLDEKSLASCDKNSSWSIGLSNDKSSWMIKHTNAIVEARTNKNIDDIYRSIGYINSRRI